jgi:cysteine desulfurase
MGIEREQVRRLRDKLERGIQERCPSVIVVGQNSDRLPNTLTALFEAVESEAILMLLDLKGICASSGSACSTGSKEPSHVLKSMGVPDRAANSAIRFSLSRYTSAGDIEYTLDAIEESIGKLRKISPYVD